VFSNEKTLMDAADRQLNRLMDEPRGVSVSEMLRETWQDCEIQEELSEQYNEI
jgi:hypothetical protein